MPLSDKQREALEAEAARRGIDPAALIREAEAMSGDSGAAPAENPKAAEKNDRPLYMYHLPFVTVNEVRTIWLGLDSIEGGEKIASKWAAEQAGSAATTSAAEVKEAAAE